MNDVEAYLNRVEEEFYKPNPSVMFILRQLYHAVRLMSGAKSMKKDLKK